jgi:hypothetical protein
VGNQEREAIWRERIEQWRASGLSQRGFALKNGYPARQVGYWVRRLALPKGAPVLLPVEVTGSVAPGVINLRSERGWTISLPSGTGAAWLAELLRAL